jgi:polysaccharide biosynthesis transport protein
MDLLYLFRVLLRKKWIILSLAILSSAAAFVFIMLKKDLYESVAQYSTGFTAEKVKLTDGSVAVDIYTLDIKFNNVIETFKSPRVIGMLSYKLLSHDLENPSKPYRVLDENDKTSEAYHAISKDTILKILNNKLLASELLSPSDKTEKKVLDFLKLYKYDYDGLTKMLIIRRVDRTDYLDIIYQSENPQLSAYVVNTLGTEFINYYKRLNDQRTTETAQNIRQLLNIQRQKVDSFTNELKIARISQGALDPVEQSKNAMETTKELQMQLSIAQSEYNLQSRLYGTYTDRLKILNAALNNTSAENALALFKRRDDLREQISKLQNPDPELTKELEEVESKIKLQSGSTTNKSKLQDEVTDLQSKSGETKARMDAASATISQLNRLISASQGISNVSPKTQVEIDAIERQLEIENNELKNLRDKLSQAEGLIRDDPTSNFRQTLIGEPDIQPVPKRKILTTGLAGMSAFAISALIFLLVEIFGTSMKTPSQFSKHFKIDLKGVFNLINLKKARLNELILNEVDESKFKKEKLFKNNVRKLRHEIASTGKKVFLINSTQSKVGKSLILESLAYSFLLSNKKVLIIDLNLENNTLTQLFNPDRFIDDFFLDGEPEYHQLKPLLASRSFDSQYLLEDIAVQKETEPYNIRSFISTTSYENLYILGCKGGTNSPSEVVSFKFLHELMKELRKKFDYILMESAAMNNRSDSYELFQFVDGVITVFSAKTVLSQSDNKSMEAVQNLNEKNFGAVLNQVEYDNVNL